MAINIKYSLSFSQILNNKIESEPIQNEQESNSPQLVKDIKLFEDKRQQKDQMNNLELIEFLKLEKEEDNTIRMSQIIQTFQLQPINLDLCNQLKQTLMKSIIFQTQNIKQTDILINRNYQVICYKSKLYGTPSIILKKYSPSNFQKDSFDIIVYSHKGQVLCSFHNFKKIDRLIKALLIRFRRLQTIFYVENVQKTDVFIDTFLEMKKLFTGKPKIIAIYKCFQNNLQNHDQQEKKQISTLQFKINESKIEYQQFKSFCLSNSIVFLLQKGLGNQKQLCQDFFQQIYQTINKKQKFDKLIFQFVCYGNKKKQQFKAKNQITIRFINYFHQKFLQSLKKTQQITIQFVKQFFGSLIKQIQELRVKLKQSNLRNKSNLIYKHFPRLMKRGARLCLHCKQKTRYLCIGCSVKHSTKISLCVLCFAPFHDLKNYYQHFPQIIKKSNSKFIPNLQKQVSSQNLSIGNPSFKPDKRQVFQDSVLKKEFTQNQIEQKEVKNEKIRKQIKKQFQEGFFKYRKMKSFVSHCYRKMHSQQKKVETQCKMQEE